MKNISMSMKNEVMKTKMQYTNGQRSKSAWEGWPRAIVKTSNMAHSFVFSADDNKRLVTVLAKYLASPIGSYLAPSENDMDYWIMS